MKIIRPFTGIGSIFFPIGPPPRGTCENATRKCLDECYAAMHKYPDFDEDVRIPDSEKEEIYRIFMTKDIPDLCKQIKSELDGLQTDILNWFGSGDCLQKDESRVCKIIEELKKHSITQMGFTRNERLWNKYKKIFAFTVEDPNEIGNRKGLFAVPDYDNQTSIMYRDNQPTKGGHCGPIICQDKFDATLDHYINCRTCQRLKVGCFYKRDEL